MGGFETMTDKLLEVALCGYLPYGVQVVGDRKIYYTVDGIRTIKTGDISIKSNDTHIGFIRELNLALRPISCLTKPITVPNYNQGKEFVPLEELAKAYIDWSDLDSNLKVNPHGPIDRQFNLEITWDHPSGSKPFFNDNLFIFIKYPHKNQQWIIDLLNQWLIDWRDLIGKGLAVSID